jgi:BolA protein
MSVQSVLEAKLKLAFRPEALDVRDESSQHEGHSGWKPGGETHFRVYIVASAFAGKSRVDMHRMINDVLAEELAGPVHALAIHASAKGGT